MATHPAQLQSSERIPYTARASEGESTARSSGATQTLLLTEDQDAVRHLARVVLERAGYRVIAAADAAEARSAALAEGIGRIAALVTDVVMPGLSGPELALELRRLRPDLPVLFLSGYSEEMARQERRLGDGEAFLAKPFSPDSLVRTVHELLGTGSGPERDRPA